MKKYQRLLIIFFSVGFLTANLHASNSNTKMTEQLYTSQTPATPKLAHVGPLPVGVKTITITGPNLLNREDGRELTLEVWYPSSSISTATKAVYSDVTRTRQEFALQGEAYRNAELKTSTEKYPLVVLSHGYTGYRSIMFYLGEHLASHGYLVAAIDHTDSTNKEIDFEENSGAGFHSTLLHRSRDQQAVLGFFKKNESTWSADTSLASVIGYSMGGYGALNTAGACHSFPDNVASAFGFDPKEQSKALSALNSCNAGLDKIDPSWKALVTLAPWGGESGVITGLEKITIPSLFIAGEEDDVSGYENGVKKLFDETGAKHKYLMVYENARHNIAPHPAPKVAYDSELGLGHYFEPAWSTETLNRINKHMILAFLNYHVKGDSQSGDMLPKRENLTQTKQADGKLNAPWPGFQNRFGTGVLFIRGDKN